jgi:hypothetical protein
VARSKSRGRPACAPRSPATSDWNAAKSADDLTGRAIERARRLADIGVTHFNIPLSDFGIDLETLGGLLRALREA